MSSTIKMVSQSNGKTTYSFIKFSFLKIGQLLPLGCLIQFPIKELIPLKVTLNLYFNQLGLHKSY